MITSANLIFLPTWFSTEISNEVTRKLYGTQVTVTKRIRKIRKWQCNSPLASEEALYLGYWKYRDTGKVLIDENGEDSVTVGFIKNMKPKTGMKDCIISKRHYQTVPSLILKRVHGFRPIHIRADFSTHSDNLVMQTGRLWFIWQVHLFYYSPTSYFTECWSTIHIFLYSKP